MKSLAFLACCLAAGHCLPPDKIQRLHVIKPRSIDINNAHGLAMESRLEPTVTPTGYRIQLEPYLDDAVFKGRVQINVTWVKTTEEISLHASHELEITAVVVRVGPYHEPVVVARSSSDPKKPLYIIRLEKEVRKGTHGELDITYNGRMQTAVTEAFFRTTYINENETESVLAATQLRPTNARRFFPCFDEPAFKASFDLSVAAPRHLAALSNVEVDRVEEIEGEPNAVRVFFVRTPPMPTFSLGLVVGDLQQVGEAAVYRDSLGNNIELRVWGRREFLPALEPVKEKLLRVYREVAGFWRTPMPINKLDVVALPNYYGSKPADNWGLIVFKESDLTSRGYLQLAQEVLYQWLGALVTPLWWSDAHLNKALVGYLAAEMAFKINNGSEMEGKWPMTVLYSLYYEFSKRYPHSRITGMKQETACTKLELLLRMFNYTLGGNTFREGLRAFVESRKFKTFSGDDIWASLDAAAAAAGEAPGVSVAAVAHSWISQDRLPLVSVCRDYEKNTAKITQRVYLRERPHDLPDAARMSWRLPLVLARADALSFTDTRPLAWLDNTQEMELDNMPTQEHFIIVNPEEIAPYPVNYDTNNWNLLVTFLQSEKRTSIPELTRAKLLHDAWNLAYAGELSFATAFNMTLFLKHERNHLVWDPIFTMIDHISRHICSVINVKFQMYVRSLLGPLYKDLSVVREDAGGSVKTLRGLTKSFLCKGGYRPCVREAQEQFAKWMYAANPDEGNPIANQYICPVFKWGTREEWEFGLQRVIHFPPSRKQSERTYLLKTLAGCPSDEDKVNRLLNVTILEGNASFTETDIFLIFSMLTGESQGYSTLFKFLNSNWAVLKERFSNKTNLWDSMITSATSQFTTQEGLDQVSKLFVEHQGEFGSAEHIIEKSIKNIREEVTWSDKNLPVINQWLDNYLSNNKDVNE